MYKYSRLRHVFHSWDTFTVQRGECLYRARRQWLVDLDPPPLPFLVVCGASHRAPPNSVLQDLRDNYGVSLPPETQVYQGPRCQVILHLPKVLQWRVISTRLSRGGWGSAVCTTFWVMPPMPAKASPSWLLTLWWSPQNHRRLPSPSSNWFTRRYTLAFEVLTGRVASVTLASVYMHCSTTGASERFQPFSAPDLEGLRDALLDIPDFPSPLANIVVEATSIFLHIDHG